MVYVALVLALILLLLITAALVASPFMLNWYGTQHEAAENKKLKAQPEAKFADCINL